MSLEAFEISAKVRTDKGKGASRRLRREGQVPGIVYGGNQEPMMIALDGNDLGHHLDHEAFYSHILVLDLDGNKENVILKDVQRHPYRGRAINHIDFLRVVAGEAIRVHVPLHFQGEAVSPGAKRGGIISHQMTEVEIECLPKDLPEFIEVDVSGLNVGDSIHLSEIVLPAGVTILALAHDPDSDPAVVTVVPPRLEEAPEAGEEGAGEGEESTGGE
ncbi:MAG: 50S ribosomal protein L25/general stress protein Ctc [Pseudomonadota bacterium]|nr:50S ribosomal protein L25/general stress protein Ctc [Pseudomonadota bacterium]